MSKPPPNEHVSIHIPQSSTSRPRTVPSSESSLEGVPDLYIISRLHRLSGNYWNKPETADCTIVVPKDIASNHFDNHRSGRDGPIESLNDQPGRPKQPNMPKMLFKLHQQYLSVQSTLLRSLLDGACRLTQNAPSNRGNGGRPSLACSKLGSLPSPSPGSIQQPSASASNIHSSRSPYILPSSRLNHPVIFLPVPDPVSVPHLIYYMYFGSFAHIEDSLQKGTLTWQGVVRNVEYLGMRVEIKAALGRYHRIWMKPTSTTPPKALTDERGGSGSESEDSEDGYAPS